MEIEELSVSLGLDTEELEEGFRRLGRLNKYVGPLLKKYVDLSNKEIFKGRQFSETGVKVDSFLRLWSQRCEQAGEEAERAMGRAGRGANRAGKSTSEAGKKAEEMGKAFQTMGMRWGSYFKGLAMHYLAPLAAGFGIGSIIKSFTGDIAQVAQMTGYYTGQMEAWYKKRAMLARVTREDLELYRKGRFAVMNFQIEMGNLSSQIMHNLSPAFRKAIELLNAVTEWLRQNRTNIIRFVAVLAGTITTLLIPAFIKMGVAMLANPMTWLIGLFLALVLVVDDFVTYLRGGKTAFGGFWSQFGSASEIMEKLEKAFERLKSIVKTVLMAIIEFAGQVYDSFSGVISPIQDLITAIVDYVDALLGGDTSGMGDAMDRMAGSILQIGHEVAKGILSITAKVIAKIGMLILGLPEFLATMVEGSLKIFLALLVAGGEIAGAWFLAKWAVAKAFIIGLFETLIMTLVGLGQKAFGAFFDWIKEKFGFVSNLIPDGIKEKLKNIAKEKGDEALADTAQKASEELEKDANAAADVIPKADKATAASVNNSTSNKTNNVDVNIQNQNVNVTTQAKDAEQIAQEAAWASANAIRPYSTVASEGCVD